MGLKVTDKTDMILGETPHAKVTLVMIDGEGDSDEATRFENFMAKLWRYVA